MTMYVPRPIDTSQVTLDDAQRLLVEMLAANTHDVWAQKRLTDGWRHGPERNDQAKTHPGLVPYSALPESEKDYDRAVVEQVIRAAIALGYRVDKT